MLLLLLACTSRPDGSPTINGDPDQSWPSLPELDDRNRPATPILTARRSPDTPSVFGGNHDQTVRSTVAAPRSAMA